MSKASVRYCDWAPRTMWFDGHSESGIVWCDFDRAIVKKVIRNMLSMFLAVWCAGGGIMSFGHAVWFGTDRFPRWALLKGLWVVWSCNHIQDHRNMLPMFFGPFFVSWLTVRPLVNVVEIWMRSLATFESTGAVLRKRCYRRKLFERACTSADRNGAKCAEASERKLPFS